MNSMSDLGPNYVHLTSGGNITRSESPYKIGGESDINNFVESYSFDEKSGELIISLKAEARYLYPSYRSGIHDQSSKNAQAATDGILNQLGTTTFEIPDPTDNTRTLTLILLNGEKAKMKSSKIYGGPGMLWFREYYDNEEKNKIEFDKIYDEVFDRERLDQAKGGGTYTFRLKSKYVGNPYVNYVINDLLYSKNNIPRVAV